MFPRGAALVRSLADCRALQHLFLSLLSTAGDVWVVMSIGEIGESIAFVADARAQVACPDSRGAHPVFYEGIAEVKSLPAVRSPHI